MLALSRPWCPRQSSSAHAFRPHVPSVRRSWRSGAVAAANTTPVGPFCQSMLGLAGDSTWESVKELIQPQQAEAARAQKAAEALHTCTRLGGMAEVSVVLLRPGQLVLAQPCQERWPPCVLKQYSTTMQGAPVLSIKEVAKALAESGEFANVHTAMDWASGSGSERILCSFRGTKIQVVLCGAPSSRSIRQQLINSNISSKERSALSISTLTPRTSELERMPALFKTAARVVKYWAHTKLDMAAHSAKYKPVHSSTDYLLEVLVLHAFEDYTAAAATASSSSAQDSSDAAALEAILRSFLELAARLPNSDVISAGRIRARSFLYNEDTALQIVLQPDFVKVLRPQGCEHHPIVLDPGDSTRNVAPAVTTQGIEMLADAARAELQFEDVKQAGPTSPTVRIQQQIDAICLQQRILVDAGDVQWDITPRRTDLWLPGLAEEDEADEAGVRVIANLTQKDVPELAMHLLARPLRMYDPDSTFAKRTQRLRSKLMMGIELRLANYHPVLRTLSEMPLPLRVTICKGSSVEFIRGPHGSMWHVDAGSFAGQGVMVLESDIVGQLGADAGPSWMVSDEQVDKFGPFTMMQYKLRLSFKVA